MGVPPLLRFDLLSLLCSVAFVARLFCLIFHSYEDPFCWCSSMVVEVCAFGFVAKTFLPLILCLVFSIS